LIRLARRRKTATVVTGHNADDVAETVLWRLLRGTSIEGLSGIARARPLAAGISLARPLLGINRRDIETYVHSLRPRVSPRRDRTNVSLEPLRNRVRGLLLPFLDRHFGPGVRGSLIRLASTAREDSEALNAYSAAAFRSAARIAAGRETPSPRLAGS